MQFYDAKFGGIVVLSGIAKRGESKKWRGLV